ncbi:MAG: transposase, partial [Solirubrobacteraceae bacterium]
AVAEQAVAQIPAGHIETIEILLRVDSAGASHELIDWCREGQIEFSVGYDLTETVRSAILQIPEDDWVCSLDQDGQQRPNGQVCEITKHLELSSWPQGTRVIVRRERAHPGAQLSFTDHDGHRFQAILTDQTGPVAELERDHRGRARVEDHIRNDKDTGMRNLPFRTFEHNQVWLQIVRLAHDLIVWTQRLLLTGELANAEPKRLRYRLLHVGARLAFHARTATLHLQASWPRGPTPHRRVHTALGVPRTSLTPPAATLANATGLHDVRAPAKPAADHPSQPPPTPPTPRDGLNRPHHPRHHPPDQPPQPEPLTSRQLVHDPG